MLRGRVGYLSAVSRTDEAISKGLTIAGNLTIQ